MKSVLELSDMIALFNEYSDPALLVSGIMISRF